MGLCPGGSLSGGLSPGGLYPEGGSLSIGVSVQGGLCLGGICPGDLCAGGLCAGVLCQGDPHTETPLCTVMSRWYASYWNAFLFGKRLKSTTTCSISESISSTLTWSVSHVYRGLFAMKGEGVPSQSALYFLFEFS